MRKKNVLKFPIVLLVIKNEKKINAVIPVSGFVEIIVRNFEDFANPTIRIFRFFFGGEENKDIIFIKNNIESKAMDYFVYKDDNDKNAKNENKI